MFFAWCIRKYLFIKINNMNQIFKYNGNAKCSAKSLKVHILAMDFWFWRYCSMKKDCQLKSSCWISNVVSKRFYDGHGKYSPELSRYFIMRRCQLNFDMFCATSALDISWRCLNHPNMLIFSLWSLSFVSCRWKIYWSALIPRNLSCPEKFFVAPLISCVLSCTNTASFIVITLAHEHGFNEVKNSCIKSEYYSIFDDYDVNFNHIWMNGVWFHMEEYGVFRVLDLFGHTSI